ncbi:hypothetical protein [Shivajiella indica]|uniref:Ig-like domain-containing protein n=1 Tax=Shivajiella indica TaxID=872115 RepID=A0ABW5B7M3_9BACT
MRKLFSYFLIVLFSMTSVIFTAGLNFENWNNYLIEDSLEYQNEGEFVLEGPDVLCLYYGGIIGDFFGGGLPTDVFSWRILAEDGSIVVEREGSFQTFSHTFSAVGVYTVELNIRRGTNQVFSSSKSVTINPGVDLVIQNSYLICNGESTELTLIDPNSPDVADFVIEWRDANGQIIGNGNTISVNQPGSYTADFFTTNDQGEVICPYSVSTNVRIPSDFTAQITNRPTGEVCEGFNSINLTAGPGILGEWFFTKDGGERVFLGEGSNFSINSNQLQGEGEYNFIFVVNDFDNRYCIDEDSVPLTVTPQGNYVIETVVDSDGCGIDNGSITIRALTDLDRLRLLKAGGNPEERLNISAGDLITFDNLGSGIYTFTSFLGACSRWTTRVINSLNDPEEFFFDIETIDESCSETGIIEGKIIVKMLNQPFTGEYQLFNNLGLIIDDKRGLVDNELEFEIPVARGNYMIELYDENGCTYTYKFEEGVSDGIIRVRSVDQVSYTIPNLLNICQSFEFIPETSQNLKFRLTYPDGSVEERNFDQTFLLDQQGEYTILGSLIDESEGLCPRERTFFVNITDPVPYDPVLVFEDCLGNKEFVAELFGANPSTVTIRWYNENDEVVATGVRFFPTSFGVFKLDVQPINSEACPIPPKEFEVRRPDLQLEIDFDATIFCPFDPVSTITISTDFNEVDSIAWIFYDGNTIIGLPQFNGLSEIEVTQTGPYEVILFSELGCEIGRKLIEIEESENLADFEIPDQLSICQFYDLVPETELDLIFTVTAPNGEESQLIKGESFTFDQDGEYIFEARGVDEEAGLCRIIKTIQIDLNQPISFEPELFSEDCDGNLIYIANIYEEDPAQFEFYWIDPSGELVGEDQFFQPTSYGEFQLEVRPKGSLPCPDPVKSFTIVQPITVVEATLEATPLCPDSEFGVISLFAELENVEKIQWYFIDINGQKEILPDFENETDIAVSQEGTYEVELINHIGCVLGSDLVLLIRSTDEIRPVTEEEYVICPFIGAGEEINPGEFEEYAWYLNNDLISTEPTLLPTAVGNYTVEVTSREGCSYSTSFTVKENCEFQLVYPNAVQPSNPEKGFMIYSNYLVDELSVWIFNKWGQLMFYCNDPEISENKPSCVWDGSFEGDFLPPGSYVLKIQYKNKNEEGFKNIIDSIMVID